MTNSATASQITPIALPRTQTGAASVSAPAGSALPSQAPGAEAVAEDGLATPTTPNRDELVATVQRLNDLAANFRRELRFAIDEASGRTIINVFNAETDELIRQIPPEELIALAEHFQELQGVFLQERA